MSSRSVDEPAGRILSHSRLSGNDRARVRCIREATRSDGEGTSGIPADAPPRERCTVCDTTFSARAEPPCYRRATDETIITQVVPLVAHGCPIAAIVVAYGIQRQTVRAKKWGRWPEAEEARIARWAA